MMSVKMCHNNVMNVVRFVYHKLATQILWISHTGKPDLD